MKLEHLPKDKFVAQFAAICSTLSLEQLATLVWRYGNEQWSLGYGLGLRNYAKPEIEE